MKENYNFLRSFTFNGKETSHLFQIAKVTVPFLTKSNEFFNVGNTDGKRFKNTKIGDYSLKIDGYIIKSHTGKKVPQVMDELKLLINSDEPKKLVFDIFPDRYFNAIFTGTQEYDATNLDYTPFTLEFAVPDGMAHAINPIGFSNTYSDTTNLMLDSEYNNVKKYMKPWVSRLDEKFNESNVVQGDFTNGIPLNFERGDDTDERWLNWNPFTTIHRSDLKVGDEVNFSVYAQVVSIDEENARTYAGEVILEEWDTTKGAIVHRHIAEIPKKATTEFTEYGSVVKIVNENTNAINLQYGFRGSNLIKWSKPMVSFLPPIGETVTAPTVGATAYSNSLDFGDYDYSGKPNLFRNIGTDELSRDFNKYTKPSNVTFVNGEYVIDTTPLTGNQGYYFINIPRGQVGKQYTYSIEARGDVATDGIAIRPVVYIGSGLSVTTSSPVTSLTAENKRYSVTTKPLTSVQVNSEVQALQIYVTKATVKASKIYIKPNIKMEEGATATPYQPNLLEEPWSLSKAPLGENIANKNVSYPISSSAYAPYNAPNEEDYEVNQTYTVTMKATKPGTQTFGVYIKGGDLRIGNMIPVEGRSHEWSITFTITQSHIDAGVTNNLVIHQLPQATIGACKINWLKVEKGTRTPHINYYKYEGIAPAPSNNPNDYHWGYSPSYIHAVEYVPSGESIGDVIKINNNGTYRTKPRFTFRMKGENGVVALLNQNGGVLQFGNPEDVDGKMSSRVEQGINETFWGKTLNPKLKVNTGFKTVYPNMNSNPETPNKIQGNLTMTEDPDAVLPVFKGVDDIGVWHGPTVVGDIAAPSTTDRTLPLTTHFRFGFDNYDKGQRGRIEFSTFDEAGNPVMTAIIRDSSAASNELFFEAWYKGEKLHQTILDRKVFSKAFYEMNMDRVGNKLTWRLVQIKSLNTAPGGWSQVSIDKEYKFMWTLPEPDKSKITTTGFWFMRFSNKYHVIMRVTDMQARWEGTPYYQDLKNYFQDGDLVEIDTATRELFVNGVVNNQLNVVGNQWEKFELETGETIVQPIVSEWANMAEVTAEITQNYL